MVTKEETWWGGINQELGKIMHIVTIYTYIYKYTDSILYILQYIK